MLYGTGLSEYSRNNIEGIMNLFRGVITLIYFTEGTKFFAL